MKFSGHTHTTATLLHRIRAKVRPLLRRVTIITILAGLASSSPAFAEQDTLAEDELKAAFVYKFAHFVTWPTSREDSITFCVTGRSSFEKALSNTVSKVSTSAFQSIVRHVEPGQDTALCNILFIAESIKGRSEETMRAANGSPVLTIGESQGFAQRGGMINFTWEGRMIRLEINRKAVKEGGLVVSSQVLKLARLIGEDAK